MRYFGGHGRQALVGIFAFSAIWCASVCATSASRLDPWDYEQKVGDYLDAVAERTAERNFELREKLMPEGAPTRAFYRHHSPWQEQLQRDAGKMGCGRFLAWAALSTYTGLALTVAAAWPPAGLMALAPLIPAAPVYWKWVGFPRTVTETAVSSHLRLLENDLEETRRELDLDKTMGFAGYPWTTHSFAIFRRILRQRLDEGLEALHDELDRQADAGFAADVEKTDRWMLTYLDLWDLGAIYERESRRYSDSGVGGIDAQREVQQREAIGLAIDEARIALLFAAGGGYRRQLH